MSPAMVVAAAISGRLADVSQLGIRAVFSTSFGGIFWDNCARNGVPAIVLPQADIDTLMKLAADPERNALIAFKRL